MAGYSFDGNDEDMLLLTINTYPSKFTLDSHKLASYTHLY